MADDELNNTGDELNNSNDELNNLGEMVLFNIQKFSMHDGPGIRTTVFFKGCPLRCRWCSNPESQPTGIQREEAFGGEIYTAAEVLKICLADKDFFVESNGGVTLSGGEALLQPKQARNLLKLLKEHQIHTALETSGYAQPAIFESVAEYADLLIYDLKHYDNKKHKQGTGVGNELILTNLKNILNANREAKDIAKDTAKDMAKNMTKDILIRIAIIPGYNDSLEDAKGFAACINEITNMTTSKTTNKSTNKTATIPVQLLPFHQFGEKKYENLGLPYEYKNHKILHAEDLQNFLYTMKEHGLNCFL